MEPSSTQSPTLPTLGFEIRFRLSDGLDEAGALELWEDFVAGPLDSRGLTYTDGAMTDGIVRLLSRPGASATEDDRRAVREWARRRGEIAGYDVGPLQSVSIHS